MQMQSNAMGEQYYYKAMLTLSNADALQFSTMLSNAEKFTLKRLKRSRGKSPVHDQNPFLELPRPMAGS